MKKLLSIIVTVAIVVAIILFLSKGFGLGGSGSGNGKDSEKETKEQQTQTVKEDKTDVEEEEVLSKVVTVTIKESQVYVGSKAIANKADLKAYIEEINNDEREFKLKEENSIQATYEWVTDVFEELEIQLLPAEE